MSTNNNQKYFQLLLSLIFIGVVMRLFTERTDYNPWRLQARGWKWVWNELSNMDGGSFYGKENIIMSTLNTDENSATPTTDISAYSTEINSEKGAVRDQIKIIVWTPFDTTKSRIKRLVDIVTTMSTNICFEDCTVTLSSNQKAVDSADALVFFMFRRGFSSEELPVRTNWDQIWIYNQHEPPTHISPGAHLNGMFNWTMTYREDSDIYQPYFKILPLAKPLKTMSPLQITNRTFNFLNWINGKTKLATAVISNCKASSKRLTILHKLQASGIPIDIYGKCGNRTTMGKDRETELLEIASKYKFYFAFENSICSDYVTEKFWRTLEQGMVPIVLGRARYVEIAPPKSFIDLRDFPRPRDLKKYLNFLDKNRTAYLEFFEWRKHHRVLDNADNFCDLCTKVKQHKWTFQQDREVSGDKETSPSPSQHTVYANLTGWWASAPGRPDLPACISPKEFGIKNYI